MLTSLEIHKPSSTSHKGPRGISEKGLQLEAQYHSGGAGRVKWTSGRVMWQGD